MPTSKLRELFQSVTWFEKTEMSPRLSAFLEGLLEELEAQRPPQLDARIATVTDERDSWERQCRIAERGLAEANLERGQLARKWGAADAEIAQLRKELAEAKAETKRQAGRLDQLYAEAANLQIQIHQEREEAKADVEIGRLVRGMRRHTRLTKADMLYKVETKEVGKWIDTYPGLFLWHDPAEALRAIQEKNDDTG